MYVHIYHILDEKIHASENQEIETDKPTEEIRQDPYSLPGGFQWDTLDLNDPLIVRYVRVQGKLIN